MRNRCVCVCACVCAQNIAFTQVFRQSSSVRFVTIPKQVFCGRDYTECDEAVEDDPEIGQKPEGAMIIPVLRSSWRVLRHHYST